MTSRQVFHSQLTSIMEALTKAAVAEICGLVDDRQAGLRLENEALRRKLELIETIIARGHRGAAGGGLMEFTAGEFLLVLSSVVGLKVPHHWDHWDHILSVCFSSQVAALRLVGGSNRPKPEEVGGSRGRRPERRPQRGNR